MVDRPARILFAQELGGGFGHVNTLLAVARHFRDHHLTFAVCDPALTRAAIEAALGAGVAVRPCYRWTGRTASAEEFPATQTMADILFLLGFADKEPLAAATRSWHAMVEAAAPDLIVSDFAPTLRLVTAARVSMVAIGNGFVVPPPVAPLPAVGPAPVAVLDRSRRREAAVLAAVNTERQALRLPPFGALSAVFQGDRTFVTTFSALDPYRAVRAEEPLQPVNIPALPIGPPVDQRTGPHVFCYLDADAAAINPVLTALNGLARPAQVYIRNIDPREVARHCGPNVGVHQGQADFRPLLPQTRLLIHHGGLGTTTAGLLAGTPQLLLPRHLEQELTVGAIAPLQISVGLHVAADADPLTVAAVIAQLLANRVMQENAVRQAGSMQAERRDDSTQIAVTACRHMLAEAMSAAS